MTGSTATGSGTTGTTATRSRAPGRPDAVCSAAVELARAAAEQAGRGVGRHLGLQAEGERAVTHLFASLEPGYVGWRWAVTIARAPRSRRPTVCDVVMLPGPDALLAPAWLPWSERLQPGDLGVGDLLPTAPDDDRLVPAYLQSEDPAVEEVSSELGLGRIRVMSRVGRHETAARWYDGSPGPAAAIAQAAPARCGRCGFYLPLAGSMGGTFGVCGNEFAPDDGTVVSADHGCGAHSEALVEAVTPAPVPLIFDDADQVELTTASRPPGSVDDEEPADPLGHG